MLEKVCLSLLIILTRWVKSRCLPAQPVQAPSVWPGGQSQAALGHNHTCQFRTRWGGGKFSGGGDVSEDPSKCQKGQKGERLVEVKDDWPFPVPFSSSPQSLLGADAEVTPTSRPLGGGGQTTECVKRFKRLGITQLNVSNSLFVFGWSSLRSPHTPPRPRPCLVLPASAAAAAARSSVRANFMAVAGCAKWELWVCSSEREGERERGKASWEIVTQWSIVTQHGALDLHLAGSHLERVAHRARSVNIARLAGICERSPSEFIGWHCGSEERVVLWRGCKRWRPLVRFSEPEQGRVVWWSRGP